jgi:MoaA/NifB/PqqE/SkfB family radical SAM enzyme
VTVTHLQIEPTSRCNFTCGFCWGRRLDPGDLAWDDVERALATFPEVTHVELQGEGEPLLVAGFLDQVAALRARGVAVSFITNGSKLTDDVAERIVALGVSTVMVSLETTDPARFQRLRGGGWPATRRGLERLVAAKRRVHGDRPAIGLAVTVLRSTVDDFPTIAALYRDLGLDGGVLVQPLNPMSGYAGTYDADLRSEIPDRTALSRLDAHLRDHADVLTPSSGDRGFYGDLYGPRPEGGRVACPWLERGLYLDRFGRYAACCMAKPEVAAFGDAASTTRAAVLEQRAAMARELASGRTPTPCAGCDVAREVAARATPR